ncbi:MAG: hypothetical protein JXA19_03745 [Anaerolineales bacterium]|nr:hypothetical protein [Anaerolineales bacterium]
MKLKEMTIEQGIFLMLLLVGISLRIFGLGTNSLSHYEREAAVYAMDFSNGQSEELGDNPAYTLLTGVLFFVGGSNDVLARLIPVFAGIGLLALLYFWKDLFVPYPALIIMAVLVFDPGLWAASRIAASPILSVFFLGLALTAWRYQKPFLLGSAVAAVLLSGPAGWAGVFLTGIMIGVYFYFFITEEITIIVEDRKGFIKKSLIGAGSVVLLGVTLLSLAPQGLGSLFNPLINYITGWEKSSGVPVTRLLIALIGYQPLAIIFGLTAIVRGSFFEKNKTTQFLSVWALLGLLLTLIYPSRQVFDLVWVLLPLGLLAGVEISRFLYFPEHETWTTLGTGVLVFVLLIFTWQQSLTIPFSYLPGTSDYLIRWGMIGMVILIGVFASLLIGFGWSKLVARNGSLMGLLAFLTLYTFGAGWNGTMDTEDFYAELWTPTPSAGQTALITSTIGDLSEWAVGDRISAEITVLGETPQLHWLLKDFQDVTYDYFGASVETETASPILLSEDIISEEDAYPGYRGQRFSWAVFPGFNTMTTNDWLKWAFLRDIPFTHQYLVVWGNSDVFP